MREMKDSGIDGIGTIPSTYTVSRIKYISDIFGRIGFRGYTQNDLVDEDEGAITLSPSNLNNMRMNYDKCSYLTWEKYNESPEIMIKEGDILFVKTGSSYGKNCYVDKIPMECTINPQLIVFKNILGNSKWFSYFLQTEHIHNLSELAVVGGTIPTMSQEKIKNFSVIVPPQEEQDKIVDFLDAKCTEIDALSADIQSEIDTLQAYKRSVITEAVTKGLDKNVEMKDSGVDWCPIIPKHWEYTNPKALFTQRFDRAFYGERQLTASQEYGIVYQDEYMEMTGNRVVTVMKDFNILKHVEVGDFVISMRSFQGGLEYSEKEGCISSAYVMLIPNKKLVYPPFFKWFFKSSKYINAIQSTSNLVRDGQAMRYANFVQVPLFIIPMDEQKKIADYLDDRVPQIDKIIAKKQEQLEVLADYKKSVIYEYVTGKKEVPSV